MRYLIYLLLLGNVAAAQQVQSVVTAASSAFGQMPRVEVVDAIAGQCGAGPDVNPIAAYCTTRNVIFVAGADGPRAAYFVAHAFGHAVQVQHGIADVALAQIRARRGEEAILRGLVERQVDCIAGFLIARAGIAPFELAELFDADPLAQPHWGRDPLRVGPFVDVPLRDRADWFARGQGGDIAACAPGEFTADLLLEALGA